MIYAGGLVSVAGKFPPQYIGGVFSGQAVGGILASLTNVLMIATGVHPTLGAFFCFVFAVVFLGFSLGLYIWLTRSEFFQHYNGETPREAIEAKEMEKGNQYVTMQSLRREKWTYTTVDSGAPPNQYLWHLLTLKAKI